MTADPVLSQMLSELRYTAFGVTRYSYRAGPTDRRYTGQIEESYISMYWIGSRWYDPALGRWASPDSDVPESQGVQGLDRYAYVNNNPVNFYDPTGHVCSDPDDPNQRCDGTDKNHQKNYYGYIPPSQKLTSPTNCNSKSPLIPTCTLPPNQISSNQGNQGNSPTLPQSSSDFTGFWELDKLNGVGLRIDGSIFPFFIFGGDVSVDIVYFGDKVVVFVTPSGQVGVGEGASLGAGIVGYYNSPYPDDYGGVGWGGNVYVIPGIGGNVAYSYSDNPGSFNGRHAQVWFIGPAVGEQMSAAVSEGYTFHIP